MLDYCVKKLCLMQLCASAARSAAHLLPLQLQLRRLVSYVVLVVFIYRTKQRMVWARRKEARDVICMYAAR